MLKGSNRATAQGSCGKRPQGETGSVRRPLTVSRSALLVEGADADFRGLIHDLIVYGHHLDSCRDWFGEQVGVTGTQYEILMIVYRFRGGSGISVSEVAARMCRSGAFITLEVSKLAARGILDKGTDPDDGRRVLLTVTRKGDRMARALAPHQRRINDILFACLDRRRFRVLRALARELVECGEQATRLTASLSTTARAAA